VEKVVDAPPPQSIADQFTGPIALRQMIVSATCCCQRKACSYEDEL